MKSTHKKIACLTNQHTHSANPRTRMLFDEIYLPAIAQSSFVADPVPLDLNSTTNVAALQKHLSIADACFADITQPTPQMWFALGCAIALKKPVCLVASHSTQPADSTLLAALGPIIHYPAQPLPSDYEALKKKIVAALDKLAPAQPFTPVAAKPEPTLRAPHAREIAKPEPIAATPTTETTETTEIPHSAPSPILSLKPHEQTALAIVARHTEGLSLKTLAQEMYLLGLVHATSIAVNSLRKKHLVERKLTPIPGARRIYALVPALDPAEVQEAAPDQATLVPTKAGLDWLRDHATEANFFTPPVPAAAARADSLIDLLARL